MGFMRARREQAEKGSSTFELPSQSERLPARNEVKPPQSDVAIQCSCPWPWHGIDGALHTAASLNRRFEDLIAQSRPIDAESNCKAVQANLPWASHQIYLPPMPEPLDPGIPSAWDTAVEAYESEQSPERKLASRLRATCNCKFIHVCAAAAFQTRSVDQVRRPVCMSVSSAEDEEEVFGKYNGACDVSLGRNRPAPARHLWSSPYLYCNPYV